MQVPWKAPMPPPFSAVTTAMNISGQEPTPTPACARNPYQQPETQSVPTAHACASNDDQSVPTPAHAGDKSDKAAPMFPKPQSFESILQGTATVPTARKRLLQYLNDAPPRHEPRAVHKIVRQAGHMSSDQPNQCCNEDLPIPPWSGSV